MSSHIGPLRKSTTALSRRRSHCSHPPPLFQQGHSNRHLTASKSYCVYVFVCVCVSTWIILKSSSHIDPGSTNNTTRTAAATTTTTKQQQKHLNSESFHSGAPGWWSIKTRHHAVLLVGGLRCNHATTTATKMAPYPQKQHGILDRASGSIVPSSII